MCAGNKQQARNQNHRQPHMEELPVKPLHIIIDQGTGDRVTGRIIGIADRKIQRLIQIRHNPQGIEKEEHACSQSKKTGCLLQFYLFFIHVEGLLIFGCWSPGVAPGEGNPSPGAAMGQI